MVKAAVDDGEARPHLDRHRQVESAAGEGGQPADRQGRVGGGDRGAGRARRRDRLVEGRHARQAGVDRHRHPQLGDRRGTGARSELQVERLAGRHPRGLGHHGQGGGGGRPRGAGAGGRSDRLDRGAGHRGPGRWDRGHHHRAGHDGGEGQARPPAGGRRPRFTPWSPTAPGSERARPSATPMIGAGPSPSGIRPRGWLPLGPKLPRSRSTSDGSLRQSHYPRRRVPRAIATTGGGHRRALRPLPVGRSHPLPGRRLGPRRHRGRPRRRGRPMTTATSTSPPTPGPTPSRPSCPAGPTRCGPRASGSGPSPVGRATRSTRSPPTGPRRTTPTPASPKWPSVT